MTHPNVPIAVVFGGSGFLGGHVADQLATRGYSVKIFDRVEYPHLKPNQEMVIGDIMNLNAVIKASEGADVIFNFAGVAEIAAANAAPRKTAEINVLGNINILEAARLAKARRFVFASTVYVFSESGSFYRVSKQASERFVEAYSEEYGLEYTTLRYGSLYGRRASEWNGIYKVLREALENNSITFAGSDNSMREYIHVEDAARLSVKALENEYANRHILITGHERMSVKSLCLMISEMLNKEIDIRFENKLGDVHYVMSPYSFSPKIGHKLIPAEHVDIGQGLLECMAEVQNQLSKEKEKAGTNNCERG
jgi:UDP-glucose 4-epimerase